MTEDKSIPQPGEAQLAKKAQEISDGKSQSIESPLEQARRVSTEIKQGIEEFNQIKNELDIVKRELAEAQLSGRGWAGRKPKSQEEIDQEDADSIIKNFMPKR